MGKVSPLRSVAPPGAGPAAPSPATAPEGRDMVWVPGGAFIMGSDCHYPEERPARRVRVDGFWIDRAPVTNRAFALFVEATGYTTFAEIAPRTEDYPEAPATNLRAGSMVFTQTLFPVRLDLPNQWWQFAYGADWRHPTGPGSSLEGMEDHPVVHVALVDVEAYAAWAGLRLPTEKEWEFAAWGGLEGSEFAWGNRLEPEGVPMANVWQGDFPWHNCLAGGWLRTSPVRSYPPNGYGLFDMIGNVWEWRRWRSRPSPCCGLSHREIVPSGARVRCGSWARSARSRCG
jgi:formylglycine-generating enzyme required for sulfatase activity